ncbi:type 1 glutamine amidotransferase domain-containing protein [Aspergillus novofumigatus IBT 16806]|uniref:D-lactate dehydratase n=1 Tax=Aspergillus novofumigatus (strain IBT 16806) TaxID=1392255 RepID=A0A2I1BVD5_ASPN1|nr:ThiJ/PfpI family protein [Aspergillus novofumigatus IBT 16806]PKX89324.1 ThiJ/PfpI family protein [Aspergillus novofumigatus IBT 16806]
MTGKKILIILSDAKSFPLKKTSGSDAGKTVEHPSGFFLMELAKPLQKILDAGYEVTFASPNGLEPVPDPLSESLLAFAGNFYERRRENELIDRMKRENGFSRPRPLGTISDAELDSFVGEVGRVLRHFHAKKKPTASLCHGPIALLSTKQAGDGSFIYKGYRITCWSDAEEKVMETMLGGEIKKVESSLRNEGLRCITVDRELVTGGNPQAANALGDQFLKMLSVH